MPVTEKMIYMKPYARLLTMLGDHLIKDETVALAEIIKNSYDADADSVNVYFNNFEEGADGNTIFQKKESYITIEDNGSGMDENIIMNHWLNPATPVKKDKKINKKSITSKGRVIQGEKGIGRYSLLKLGSEITITTRPCKSNTEYVIKYDLSAYEEDFFDPKKKEYLFLEHIPIKFIEQVSAPDSWGENGHGTKIEIKGLKGVWSPDRINEVHSNIRKLKPIFENFQNSQTKIKDTFDVQFYINNKKNIEKDISYIKDLNTIMEEKSVLKVRGSFIENEKAFKLRINNNELNLSLDSSEIKALKVYKDFMKIRGELLNWSTGSFNFEFYIFDFSSNVSPKFKLDQEERVIIKGNRVYLYRDGIRVYPYGASNDDWLGIDIYRGTVSAGGLLSNDQIVGCVSISQKDNPNLEDATSREGLLNNQASMDFVGLLKILLAYIRAHPYGQYQSNKEQKQSIETANKKAVEDSFFELKKSIEGNKKAELLLSTAEDKYKKEKQVLVKRAELAEDLAGVGISVETASHDIMLFMHRALEHLDALMYETTQKKKPSYEEIHYGLVTIRGAFSFVHDKLKNIQLLFKSSNQKKKSLRIKDVINQILSLFKKSLNENNIKVEIEQIGTSPLVVKTYDAVIMQVLINLFDNAIYWLSLQETAAKNIKILLDSDKNILIFSDSGPGICEDDENYIFEPFFSGKGEDGRGLGLYIAKQLLMRHDFMISLSNNKKENMLKGATFIVDFNSEEK